MYLPKPEVQTNFQTYHEDRSIILVGHIFIITIIMTSYN